MDCVTCVIFYFFNFLILSYILFSLTKFIFITLGQALKDASQKDKVQDWIRRLKLWLEEVSLFQQTYFNNEQNSKNTLRVNQLSDRDLPIWLAAQRAVSRYEGFLSAAGPRGRLLRKLLARFGLIPPTPKTPVQLDSDSSVSEPYLRFVKPKIFIFFTHEELVFNRIVCI